MPLSRRQFSHVVFGGAAASLLVACAAPAPSAAPTAASGAASSLVKPRANGAPLTAVQASSELAVGRNRFAIGLIDDRNQPVTDGSVNLEFFKIVSSSQAEKRSESPAVF